VGTGFSKAVRNFSFALQRWDSLSMPLLKIFQLLPAVINFLQTLTSKGDRDDGIWARSILQKLTGPNAFMDLVSAAMATDAMLIGQELLRKDDKEESSIFMKASEAFE